MANCCRGYRKIDQSKMATSDHISMQPCFNLLLCFKKLKMSILTIVIVWFVFSSTVVGKVIVYCGCCLFTAGGAIQSSQIHTTSNSFVLFTFLGFPAELHVDPVRL